MTKWLTALTLIAALGVNALAGFPAHQEEKGCPMPDCCETARAQGNTPEAFAARACCALNCPRPSPVGSADTIRLSPLAPVPAHPAAFVSPAVANQPLGRGETLTNPVDSNPAYILHLALLI